MSDRTNYFTVRAHSARMKECNDCAVVAVSILTEEPYEKVHALFEKHGRKRRRGTKYNIELDVLKDLGFSYRSVEFRAKTIRTLVREVKKKNDFRRLLCHVKGHLFAIKKGVHQDYPSLENRCKRVDWVREVFKGD